MKFNVFMVLTLTVTNGLLFFVYTGTIIKACRGSQYKTVIRISALLMAATVGYLVNALGLYKFWLNTSRGTTDDLFTWICVMTLG